MTRWLVGLIVAAFTAMAGVGGPGVGPAGEAQAHRAMAAAATGSRQPASVTPPKAVTEEAAQLPVSRAVPELPRTGGAGFLKMLGLTGLFIGSGLFLLLIGLHFDSPPSPADADASDPWD